MFFKNLMETLRKKNKKKHNKGLYIFNIYLNVKDLYPAHNLSLRWLIKRWLSQQYRPSLCLGYYCKWKKKAKIDGIHIILIFQKNSIISRGILFLIKELMFNFSR